MAIFPNAKPGASSGGSSNPPAKKQAVPQSARWKPTAEEQVEIEDLTYTLLASGLLKSDIKRHLRKWAEKKQKSLQAHHPNIVIEMDARTIERYLSRARERMVAESGKSKDELRQDSLNYYLAITRDPSADHRSKLIARERIDRLYGLEMPLKVAPTDPTGQKPYANLSDEELDTRIAEALAARSAGGDAEAIGSGS